MTQDTQQLILAATGVIAAVIALVYGIVKFLLSSLVRRLEDHFSLSHRLSAVAQVIQLRVDRLERAINGHMKEEEELLAELRSDVAVLKALLSDVREEQRRLEAKE
jgi:hypothetical protein